MAGLATSGAVNSVHCGATVRRGPAPFIGRHKHCAHRQPAKITVLQKRTIEQITGRTWGELPAAKRRKLAGLAKH